MDFLSSFLGPEVIEILFSPLLLIGLFSKSRFSGIGEEQPFSFSAEESVSSPRRCKSKDIRGRIFFSTDLGRGSDFFPHFHFRGLRSPTLPFVEFVPLLFFLDGEGSSPLLSRERESIFFAFATV